MKWIIILLLLASCSTQRKCQRHYDKLKGLNCLKTTSDTVFKYDTVIGFKIDTIFKTDSLKEIDTFTMVKEGVKVVTVVKYKDKIVYQTLTKDTVITKRTEIINNPVKEVKVEVLPSCVKWLIGLLLLMILGLIFMPKK